MKRILFAMVLMALLVSTELAVAVHGRTLRSNTTTVEENVGGGCEEQRGASVSSFAVLSSSAAANDSGSRGWFRRLGFRLASGPSRRGPGH
ncbi:hypothetical protein HRI_003928200 [Hibiscus trionum]|uniref:Secreted protein n=1 Tax=Hibiscus trionum TaxID=183268 RepID=A0A9W7MK23_HIBTR|nr:hypothetical protein HRI_003928200 [Hibiscus trionum]